MRSRTSNKWISIVTLWCMLFSAIVPIGTTAAADAGQSAPELFVTEIHPDVVGTDSFEFFEVYNNSNQTLRLNDYTFLYRYPNPATTPDVPFTFADNTMLAPQQVMVFWYNNASPKNDLAAFNAKYGVSLTASQVTDVAGFNGFSNTAARAVVIKSKAGVEIAKSGYAATEIAEGLGVHFKLPASGVDMAKHAIKSAPTPGSLDLAQIPAERVILPDPPANEPPVIAHTPVTEASAGTDLTISASITDAEDSVSASVYYKKTSQSSFTALPMSSVTGSTYSALIAKEVLTEPELQYYIQAKDAAHTVTTDTYTVAVNGATFDFTKVPAMLITELVPDTTNVGSGDGYEFVEIYNNTTKPIALSDYRLLYRYTNSDTPDGVWELPSQAVLEPMKPLVFWIMNGSNADSTAASFNSIYGTSLVENVNLFRIDGGGGMANGGKRKIVIASKAGKEIAEAYYDNDNQTVANKGIFYRYPTDGSNQMAMQAGAGTIAATPGTVEPDLLPAQPAKPLNKLPVIEHTPVTKGSIDNDLVVTARITDPDNGPVAAAVYYKVPSASSFQPVVMTAGPDNTYSGTIAKSALTETELQYYVQAQDDQDTVKTAEYIVQISTGAVDFSKLPPLLITELVPDSTNVGSADGYEFIEIYNNTTETINLKDYKIQYRYTSSGPDADVVWPTDREDMLIPSRQTAVFWIINAQNTAKTVADFNALYGTSLVENENIFKMYSGGMANGGDRGIVIATNTRKELSAAYYDTDAETVANKGIFYKYAPTGDTKMIKYSAGLLAATPGRVEPQQVPIVPVTLPADSIEPTFNNLTDVTAIDQSQNLEIIGEALDANGVKSVALYYKTNLQSEYTKRYLAESFADTYYHYKVYAPELIGRAHVDYYFVISDGRNELTTETYRINVTGGPDRSELRLNVADGEILSGTRILKGTSEHAPVSELQLSIDGSQTTDGVYAAVEKDAYFAFDVTGVNYYFKNGVTMGEEILQIFDDTINDYITLTVPIQVDRLKSGSNVISIRAGTKASPFDNREEENKDDFDIRNVRLVLSDGTELYDARYTDREAVIRMGDSAGKNPFIDFNFMIPEEKLASKAYAWDTRSAADGEHTVSVSHAVHGTKTARIQVDNTAPAVVPSIEEGKLYRGAFTIAADVSDALAGVEKVEAWLDEDPITLPYATASSKLAPGSHTLRISAVDKVGNAASKVVPFQVPDENPLKPELVAPLAGQTGVSTSAVLTVKVADPTGDNLNVSFYQGFTHDAASAGSSFSGYRNAVDVEPPRMKVPAGETAFAAEDYDKVRAADGKYLIDDAVTQFPYHRFQVKLDETVKATDAVELSWKGNSLEGRKVSMYVWSPSLQQWKPVDSHVAGTEDFELSAWIQAGDYAEGRMLQVMVQDELPVTEDNYDFSFVWMSDTQYYSESYPHIYEKIVNWIAENKEAKKIKYVAHTGDIVDEADKPIQWERADADMKVLENAGIPYGVLAGNHDVAGKAGAYDQYWKYFGEDRFKNQPTWGGSIDNNRGHYDLVSSDGNDFIFIYMGWGIRDSDIEWMNKVLSEHPDRKAVLNFHEFLLVSGNRAPIADKIFEEVVKPNKNVFAVLSGHYHDAELLVDEMDDNGDGVNDRKVYQMLADYQGGPEGGQGYIRLLQFDIANNKMHVKTYSPYLDDYNFYDPAESPGKDEFSLDVDLKPKTKRVATDYMGVNVYTDQRIGVQEHVAAGQQASVSWNGLGTRSTYGWYTVAEDVYTGRSMSSIWQFTTGDGGTLPDVAAPVWTDGSLTASEVGTSSLRLNWTGATDNVGVTKYNVLQNGVVIATVTGTTYEVSGLSPNTMFAFKVVAGDAAGNWSANGPELTVITAVVVESDVAAPVWTDGSLTALEVETSSLRLNWTGATDNVGVTKYNVLQNGVVIATVTGTTYEVIGLSPNTMYAFKVEAGDAAGNWSANGPELKIYTNQEYSEGDPQPESDQPQTPPTTGNKPAPNPKPNGNGTPVKANETKEALPDGSIVTKLEVSAEALTEALAAAGRNGHILVIQSNTADASKVLAALPAAALVNAVQKAPDTIVSIRSGGVSYNLPLNALDIHSLAGSLGAEAHDMQIIVQMEKVQGSEARTIGDKAKQSGLTLLGTPVEFSVSVEAGGKSQEVKEFGSIYVSRTIEVGQSVDPARTTAVLYDPATGEMFFVPATFQVVDGKTIVTMMRNGNSIYTVAQTEKTFADVSQHWAKSDIELMASKLILKGVSGQSFAPDQGITRAEFAAMVTRALGLTENAGAARFQDVNGSDWFAGSVGAAANAGLVQGFEDGSFRPDTRITREQMAVMISRALAFAGKAESGADLKLLEAFKDRSAISSWAQSAVAQAVQASIIEGMEGGQFVPSEQATRAQTAVMLKRMLKVAQFINE
ncbi:S-layer homology domain-containing protein [Paenibacillus chartarius]|uniref:S-layer homology domain-containing protein n=1 Tax=Paenibacillus chartarius TaxID=747481 RepID=A0ABV6DMY4_9BACL